MNNAKKEEYRKLVLSPFFKAGLFKVLPMAGIAGLKITELDDLQCKVTVPYKYLNKKVLRFKPKVLSFISIIKR